MTAKHLCGRSASARYDEREEILWENEGFKTRVENDTKMSTTGSGSESNEVEELAFDDAPNW